MSYVLPFIYVITGFALMVYGADFFVDGSSNLARKLGISSLIVGLTVVAFGTSTPELAVSITAGMNGSNEISLGNVIGSNIFNTLMVLGMSAIIAPLVVDKKLLKRDWLASVIGVGLVYLLIIFDGIISRVDGIILLACFGVILFLQIKGAKSKKNNSETDNEQNYSQTKLALLIIIGIAFIVLGGELAVNGASEIARLLGLTETLIGLTVIALGTSLPELVTSVVATKKGETSIAIGNVIGSNLFNIFLVLGVSCAINPIPVQQTAYFDTMFLFIISLGSIILAKFGKLNKIFGAVMILNYVVYMIIIICR